MVTFLAFVAYMFCAVKIVGGLLEEGRVRFGALLGLIGSAFVIVSAF